LPPQDLRPYLISAVERGLQAEAKSEAARKETSALKSTAAAAALS
jgi:hypothetical protein